MRLAGFICLLASAHLRLSLAALYSNLKQLPKVSYDFVVIGAGPGGSVVATRLSENPSVKVLLVEAGQSQTEFEDVEIPFLSPTLAPGTPLDWNYTTTPLPGFGGRSITYPRGRVLGGSSSINYLVWTRGSSDDWNRYAKIAGDDGWSWDSIQPIIRGIEQLVPPADQHNTNGEVDPAIHGKSGPLGISVQGWPDAIDQRIIATTQQLPELFPFNEDMNSGNPLGIGWTQSSIHNGSRSSSASAYLDPVLSRPNLHVLINTQATKIIKTDEDNGVPCFQAVELASDSEGPRTVIHATKEVIVSTGAVNTPKLLMLSGIGNKTELERLKIKTIVDLPGVGSNLHDHTDVSVIYSVNSNFTLDDILRNTTLIGENVAEWEADRKGPFASGPTRQIGWFRLPDNSSIFKTVPDPTAGPLSPHYEFLFFDLFTSRTDPSPLEGHFMTILVTFVAPTARGSVTLNSTDPFASPLIDPGNLNSEFDVFAMREAIKAAQKVVTAPVWADYVTGPASLSAQTNATDAEIDAFNARTAWTIFHPVGTAKMGPWNDKTGLGVVNPDLTVKGTAGLRVVDASVIPIIPGGHTQAPTYVFAERASKLIKATFHV